MQASPVARSAGRSDGGGPANADGQVGQQTAREPPPRGAPEVLALCSRYPRKGANRPHLVGAHVPRGDLLSICENKAPSPIRSWPELPSDSMACCLSSS